MYNVIPRGRILLIALTLRLFVISYLDVNNQSRQSTNHGRFLGELWSFELTSASSGSRHYYPGLFSRMLVSGRSTHSCTATHWRESLMYVLAFLTYSPFRSAHIHSRPVIRHLNHLQYDVYHSTGDLSTSQLARYTSTELYRFVGDISEPVSSIWTAIKWLSPCSVVSHLLSLQRRRVAYAVLVHTVMQ